MRAHAALGLLIALVCVGGANGQAAGDVCPDEGVCAAAAAANCESWGGFGACSVAGANCSTGLQIATRSCSQDTVIVGGTSCFLQTACAIICSATEDCSIDGGYSAWGPYTTCPCVNSTAEAMYGQNIIISRSRTCTNPEPQQGGAGCAGDNVDFQLCTVGLCDTSGVWGPFTPDDDACCGAAFGWQTRQCFDKETDVPVDASECDGESRQWLSCSAFPCPVVGQCAPPGINDDIIAYAAAFTNCSVITGTLYVESTEATSADLDNLHIVTEIQGNVLISNNTMLNDLEWLRSLKNVQGTLSIINHGVSRFAIEPVAAGFARAIAPLELNNASIAGLRSLAAVGSLVITNNPGIVDVTSLAALQQVGGELYIANNGDSLPIIDGLPALVSYLQQLPPSDDDVAAQLRREEVARSVAAERQSKADAEAPYVPVGSSLPNIGYAGRGYDLYKGNPFDTLGIIDQGFRRPVISQQFTLGRFTPDGYYALPDVIDAIPAPSSTFSSEFSQISTTTEYEAELSESAATDWGVTAEVPYVSASGGYSASDSYKTTTTSLTAAKSTIIQIEGLTVSYVATLLDVAPTLLDPSFQEYVTNLPVTDAFSGVLSDPVLLAYLRLLLTFGTHYTYEVTMGGRATQTYILTEAQNDQYQQQIAEDAAAANAGVEVGTENVNAGADFSTDYSSLAAQSLSTFVSNTTVSTTELFLGGDPSVGDFTDGSTDSLKAWAQTVDANPAPVLYKLLPLALLMTPRQFPNDVAITTKAKLVLDAMGYYCEVVGGTNCFLPPQDPPVGEGYLRFGDLVTIELGRAQQQLGQSDVFLNHKAGITDRSTPSADFVAPPSAEVSDFFRAYKEQQLHNSEATNTTAIDPPLIFLGRRAIPDYVFRLHSTNLINNQQRAPLVANSKIQLLGANQILSVHFKSHAQAFLFSDSIDQQIVMESTALTFSLLKPTSFEQWSAGAQVDPSNAHYVHSGDAIALLVSQTGDLASLTNTFLVDGGGPSAGFGLLSPLCLDSDNAFLASGGTNYRGYVPSFVNIDYIPEGDPRCFLIIRKVRESDYFANRLRLGVSVFET